ncbi:MAG: pilin [Candidatus Saccharimonadales bacterium]|nr:pilin [Candidatus Saccharimonadales bacterium]
MKRLKLLAITILPMMLFIASPVAVLATDPADEGPASGLQEEFVDDACKGITGQDGDCGANGSDDVNNLLANTLSILSYIVGAASVIMIVIGGLRYVFSSGDPQQAAAARNTIIYSVIGLVVALAAQGIIRIVFDNF